MANLFIAMGGSGVKTVKEIRKKQRDGDFFLFIDTDTNDLVDDKGNPFSPREVIDISRVNVTSYLNTQSNTDPIRRRVDDWLDPSARVRFTNGPLKDGASALRPQGRLAIAQINVEFQSQIHSLIEGIFIDDENVARTDLNIFIVLSVAGGTGSSIYLDLTKVLYDKLYDRLENNFNKPTVLLYMPDAFVAMQKPEQVDRYKTNVFAFWKELDALQRDYFLSIDMSLLAPGKNSTSQVVNASATRSTYFQNFSVIPNRFTADTLAFQVFESAILIDHKNSDGNITKGGIKSRYMQVARLLEMISVRTYGGAIKSALNNQTRDNAVNSINNSFPWVKQYWSAGYAEIKGGSELFQQYVKANITRLVFESFVGVNGATKDKLDEAVKPLFENHLLSYIEKDNYNGYVNKAKEENGKPMNLHAIMDKYFAENINSNLEMQYSSGVEAKDDTSGEGLLSLFNNDIKEKVAIKLSEFIKASGFNIDSVTNKILNEFYENCTEIALTDGLQRLGFVLEALDTKIDDLAMVYDSEIKALADKKSNVLIDNQDIANRNLADTIISQYADVKEGPSRLNFQRTQWYENELTSLKNLIIAYFKYQSEELALKLKMEICDKISLGKKGDMPARDRVTKLISTLTTKISNEIAPNAHNHLISNYLEFKDNALTSIIPDVTKFSDIVSFDDPKKNVFKRIFENECGLATKIKDGKSFIVSKKSEKSDENTKTIEDLIRIVFGDSDAGSKYLITNLQSGAITDTKFIEEFGKLIDDKLIKKLNTILTKGQSNNNEATGYPKYAAYTLEKWITEDSESFDSIKKKFDSRASVFCHFRNEITANQLWVSPLSLKNRIDEIYSAEGNMNIPTYAHNETSEDVIVSIKYIANLSFDDYSMYELYKNHYRICLSDNINNFAPHIDVRFKEAMSHYLYNVEDQYPIIKKMIQVSGSASGTNIQNQNHGIDRMKKYLESYSQYYFLAVFYQKLNNPLYISIYNSLVVPSLDFKLLLPSDQKDKYIAPVFFENNQIMLFAVSSIEQMKRNGKLYLDGSINKKLLVRKLTLEDLIIKFNEIQDQELESNDANQLMNYDLHKNTNLDCIKKRYTLSQDKQLMVELLHETIVQVSSDLTELYPGDYPDFKETFDQYFGAFKLELNKLTN